MFGEYRQICPDNLSTPQQTNLTDVAKFGSNNAESNQPTKAQNSDSHGWLRTHGYRHCKRHTTAETHNGTCNNSTKYYKHIDYQRNKQSN